MNDTRKSFLVAQKLERIREANEEAESNLAQLRAARELVKCNDLACIVEIAGLSFGLCQNENMLPVIDAEIAEIEKFLSGQLNNWE